MKTLSDYVMERVAQKVDTVFFIPGGGNMHLVESLGNNKNLLAVSMLHEQGASFAAQAYGMYHGLGVCLTTSGPGATNAITGVAAAWMDGYPMLVISGQVKTSNLMKGKGVRSFGSQEVDIIEMVKSITKYAITVMEPDSIKEVMDTAFEEAMTGRKAPVWIDIPVNLQAGECHVR